MRIGSLFSGAGGLDMAVEEVFGGEVIWQAEVDKAASKVLAYRFPCAPNLGDITQIDWKTVETPDVLCGGFPCQDVSAAGKRAGIKDGTRSGLWSVFADAIDQLRPPLVVIENVRGLLSAQAHRNVEPDEAVMGDGSNGSVLRALGAVLGDLADLGYDAQWATVAASSVGAPHRRERVFIVGTLSHPGHHAGRTEQRVEHETQTGWAGQPGHRIATDKEGVTLLPTPCAQQSGCSPEDHLRKKPGRKVVTDLAILVENGLLETGGALLPTPNAGLGEHRRDNGQDPAKRRANGRQVSLADVACYELGDEPGVALLPTPRATDPSGAQSRSSAGFRPQLGEVVRQFGQPHDLLPTPRSSDCFGAGHHGDGGMDLRTTISELSKENDAAPEGRSDQALRNMRGTVDPQAVRVGTAGRPKRVPEADALLPIMREQPDHGAGRLAPLEGAEDQTEGSLRGLRDDGEPAHPSQGQEPREQRTGQLGGSVQQLPQEAALAGGPRLHGDQDSGSRWGRYEAAIRRWETVLGRPAPEPTEPNKNGNPRLAAEFSSWMMGWPRGWVTDPDIGISRNDQLKIVGNGVCPQQAIAALRYLLTVAEVAA